MHKGHRERLKRRFINQESFDGFEPHEILELLLFYAIPQGDVNPLAHELIDHFGSLPEVFAASREELMQFKGIGEHSATLITMIQPLNRALKKMGQKALPRITGYSDAAVLAHQLMDTSQVERVALIMMDAKGKVLRTPLLAEGTTCAVSLSIPKILEWVVRVKPASIILVHNHPGGDITPSYNDDHGTLQLLIAMKLMEVSILDHLVVNETECYSYERENRMEGLRQQANIRAGQARVGYNPAR
jgi:DNA repair protein RadC